jgi:hypothetical protein
LNFAPHACRPKSAMCQIGNGAFRFANTKCSGVRNNAVLFARLSMRNESGSRHAINTTSPPPATSIIDLPMQWPALAIAVVCAVIALLKQAYRPLAKGGRVSTCSRLTR